MGSVAEEGVCNRNESTYYLWSQGVQNGVQNRATCAVKKTEGKCMAIVERVGMTAVMVVVFLLLLLPIVFYSLPVEVQIKVRIAFLSI